MITLFIANASGNMNKLLNRIESAYKKATKTVSDLLGLDMVDVICIGDASMVIPEIGVGGYTPSRHITYLYIDPDFDVSEDEIYATLCHEMYHAKRYDGEGYGRTLFDSMIFEGLATAFEDEISNNTAFMPVQLLSRKNTASLVSNIKNKLPSTDFDHFQWFIFDSSGKLPRWAGYEVGYYLVRQYMKKNNKKASELVLEASSNFSL
jgi:uncharacterized protein YjaZ